MDAVQVVAPMTREQGVRFEPPKSQQSPAIPLFLVLSSAWEAKTK
jgi:hypothetical protein